MAEETTEKKPSGGNKGLIIALIVVVVLLIVAIGVGVWLFMSGAVGGKTPEVNATAPVAQSAAAPAVANGGGEAGAFQADINDLVLNITDAKGREKLMKLSFSLKSTEPTIQALVDANKAEITDTVIGQISSRSAEELLTVGGKELLKEELLEEVNKILNAATVGNAEVQQNSVKRLFFTSFVLK